MKPRSSRVPVVLQQIFLKSSGGEDIQNIQPPKNGLGFRVFIFQQTKDSKGKTNLASSSEEGKKSDTSQTLKRVDYLRGAQTNQHSSRLFGCCSG